MKRLDYLNLEIVRNPIICSTKDFKHWCYFPETAYLHQLHSNNPVLNSLIDLLLKLSESLCAYQQRQSVTLDLYSEKLQEKNLITKTLCDQVAYLKKSQEELYQVFKSISLLELPTRTELRRLTIESRDLLVKIKALLELQKAQTEQQNSQICSLLNQIKDLQYMWMQELKYKNSDYLAATSFASEFSSNPSEKFEGYITCDSLSKSDRIQIQQNNTIIALLSSLHYRITQLEKIITSPTSSNNFSTELENITKNIQELSLGNLERVKKPKKSFTFLKYDG